MKKIFFWLLKIFSKTEQERLEIHKVLNEQVSNTYREQNVYGNVYNAHIEFIMANEFIKKLVKENDEKALKAIDIGLQEAFTKSLQYIQNEKL